jgi:hypothetical protein
MGIPRRIFRKREEKRIRKKQAPSRHSLLIYFTFHVFLGGYPVVKMIQRTHPTPPPVHFTTGRPRIYLFLNLSTCRFINYSRPVREVS